MTLGKLVVGLWIPVAEIRVRRRPVSAFPKTDSVASQDVSLAEKGVDKKARNIGGRWIVEWPTRSSIAPGMMLSTAMVARGEIGFVYILFMLSLSEIYAMITHHTSQYSDSSSSLCFVPRSHWLDRHIRGRLPRRHLGRHHMHRHRSDHIFAGDSALRQHRSSERDVG